MMSRIRCTQSVITVCVVGVMLVANVDARAQSSFPNRPVRLVNPFTPGGSVDLVGRAVAVGLSAISIMPSVYRNMRFDTVRDLSGIKPQ